MIATIRPLLTEAVEHWNAATRDIHGRATKSTPTRHAARVVLFDGEVSSPFTKAKLGDTRALIWLIDHPRTVSLGDQFDLPNRETMKVIRLERRSLPGGTLHKVYLS
ncbi:MAG: hypothetical protein JKY97_12205 [Citromicrobium sp.]|nr:hypothetical protein [Citromicrobium sp.]